jgi:hypothetical protein
MHLLIKSPGSKSGIFQSEGENKKATRDGVSPERLSVSTICKRFHRSTLDLLGVVMSHSIEKPTPILFYRR